MALAPRVIATASGPWSRRYLITSGAAVVSGGQKFSEQIAIRVWARSWSVLSFQLPPSNTTGMASDCACAAAPIAQPIWCPSTSSTEAFLRTHVSSAPAGTCFRAACPDMTVRAPVPGVTRIEETGGISGEDGAKSLSETRKCCSSPRMTSAKGCAPTELTRVALSPRKAHVIAAFAAVPPQKISCRRATDFSFSRGRLSTS